MGGGVWVVLVKGGVVGNLVVEVYLWVVVCGWYCMYALKLVHIMFEVLQNLINALI